MQRRTVLKGAALGGVAVLGAGFWALPSGEAPAALSLDGAQQLLAGLVDKPLVSLKGWSPAEVFNHCAQSIEYSISGYPELKPAWFRSSVGPLAFSVFTARIRGHDIDFRAILWRGKAHCDDHVPCGEATENLDSLCILGAKGDIPDTDISFRIDDCRDGSLFGPFDGFARGDDRAIDAASLKGYAGKASSTKRRGWVGNNDANTELTASGIGRRENDIDAPRDSLFIVIRCADFHHRSDTQFSGSVRVDEAVELDGAAGLDYDNGCAGGQHRPWICETL